MPEKKRGQDVSSAALVVSVLVAIALTAVIVGSIVFAWQNSETRKDLIFREELQRQEREALEKRAEILEKENAEAEERP